MISSWCLGNLSSSLGGDTSGIKESKGDVSLLLGGKTCYHTGTLTVFINDIKKTVK